MTKQDEQEYVLQLLESAGVHLRYREEYALDSNGERTGRIIKDLFWISSEQIKMAISGFMYETDATFGTNSL